jgi:hypothetical protein
MSRKNNLDKFQEIMFADLKDIDFLSEVERAQVLRYRFAFTESLENPSIADNLLRDMLMENFKISMSQAYRDISNIKIILPNIRNAGKEWIRYVVNEELKEAIKACKDAGDEKLKERIMAIDKLAKYNKLDQDDAEELPWDDIIPVPIEPTSDPTVLKIKPLENKEEEIRKMYEKYLGEIEIEEVEYQDITEPDERKETDLFQ